VQGGHGKGGTAKCVDLSTGQVWTGAGSNQLALRGQVLSHGGGRVHLMIPGPSGLTRKSHMFDGGAHGLSELGYSDQRIFIQATSGLTCLYTGHVRPIVANGPGAAWDGKAAGLKGKLVNAGGKQTGVFLCYGLSDGGTNAAAWDTVLSVGSFATAGHDLPAQLTGLEKNRYYYYRFTATNGMGCGWAPKTEWFTTLSLPLIDCDAGLLVHYTCDEPGVQYLSDVSGNGNHAWLDGKPHPGNWVDGKVGGAIKFDGSGTSATRSTLSRKFQGTYSIAFWLKLNAGVPCMAIARSAGVNTMSMAKDVNGHARLLFGGRYNNMKDGDWRHYAFVVDNGAGTVYINGNKHATSSVTTDVPYGYLQLGGGACCMDDFRLYDRVLSVEEVRLLHAMGSQSTPPTDGAVANASDAEESASGLVTLDGTELNLGESQGGEKRTVGLRFDGLAMPRGATIHSATIQFRAGGDTNGAHVLLNAGSLGGYGGENQDGTAVITDAGRTITLTSNIWQSHPQPYQIKSGTMMTFGFRASGTRCEAHAIGMDSQTASVNRNRMFTLYGGSWGITTYRINNGKSYKSYYRLPIGSHYTGSMSHIVFVNDDDNVPIDSWSRFSDIRLFEGGAGQSTKTYLMIGAEASDNAPAFAASPHDLSSRQLGTMRTGWVPPSWNVGEMDAKQETPNLAGIVQEIVDRDGWTSGNAIAFLISGTGRRIADASEKAWGLKPQLNIVWSSESANLDSDGLPDAWERIAGGSAPTGLDPEGDNDGDGIPNWQEYLLGSDADTANALLPMLSLHTLVDGRIVARIDGRAADPLFHPGQDRYYTLLHQDAMPAGTGTVSTMWNETFAGLPNGANEDTGDTAWTASTPGVGQIFYVTNGVFQSENTGGEKVWRSETLHLGWKEASVSVRLRSSGKLDSTDYIKVRYRIDGGPEEKIAEKFDNFNGDSWLTVSRDGIRGETLQIVVRANSAGGERYFFDDVKISNPVRPYWPAVPSVSNTLVTTDRVIEYTNDTPARTGFYRLRAVLK